MGRGRFANGELLCRSCREIDMRASPYGYSSYGMAAIQIETAAGRMEYEQAQRSLAQQAQPIRSKLINRLEVVCQ